MDIWIQRLGLGILFLVMELFMLNAYFLSIGLTAIIIGLLVYVFSISNDKQSVLIMIFLFMVILNIYVLGYVVKPLLSKLMKDNSKQKSLKYIGERLIVQIIDNKKVVYTDGSYFEIISDGGINPGDTVQILKKKRNKFQVKKIF